MSAKMFQRHLPKLLFMFFIFLSAWGTNWYIQAKFEADARFTKFNQLLACKDEMGGCWQSADFNKLNYTDKIVKAAKDGLDAEFMLPWPARDRIGSYSGVILRLPPVERVPKMSAMPSVVT